MSEATRWRILLELDQGDALPVGELAKRTGRRPDAISGTWRCCSGRALVERVFSTCYRLPEAMRAGPGEKTIDLGPCVLKLDALG
ncbi:MAG TPA: hypothetical protein VGO11_23035 [Chthoniobacteraceae bacterium]|nr:hypothetical protein [Chthoniobacteraceae bacterium]